MPLEPRFRRVAALNRAFVDREPALEAFAEEWGGIGSQPRVLNLVGVGGIGKSRLLREIHENHCKGARTAVLDLQVPAMRQQEDALAALRAELGRQGVRFDRFDIAYAVLWQRLHPHLQVTRRELPFIGESEILGDIVDGVAGAPIVGTAIGLMKLLDRAVSESRRKHRIRTDSTLSQLDGLTTSDLVDSVTYLFAEDLREASESAPYAVFVDAYEALVPAPTRSGRGAMADVWLRDLIFQLDRGLSVMASREPLGWGAYDREWADIIRVVRLDALPMSARQELLAGYGIRDASEVAAVVAASEGVPYYLHLAVDTTLSANETARTVVVSSEEILQRFLHNVSSREVRALELLGVPRVFDFDIYRTIAEAHHLPADRVTWESLTSYSFIYPSEGNAVRLHQLMRSTLLERLSREVTQDVASLLAQVWHQRAETELRQDKPALQVVAGAIRETVYSRLQAGSASGEWIISQADTALGFGGRQVLEGIVADLRNHLNAHPETASDDLAMTTLCLEAESAVMLGQGARAGELTTGKTWHVETVPGARLATAAANGHRIDGDTAVAQAIYRRVWEGHPGPARNAAGVWLADLDMCQGRFGEAVGRAEQILAGCPAEDYVTRGDVERLLHLTYRFAMDFDRSMEKLRAATALYERASSLVGRANVLTNTAELLAWTDPSQALAAGQQAITAQSELGALHELGKAYTAIAVAELRLGDLARSAANFESGVRNLDRAHYRSGRARAELFRAALYARSGDLDAAVRSAVWAVEELEAAKVYPTLILAAARFLDHLGRPHPTATQAAVRARAAIRPLDTVEALEQRLDNLIGGLLGD